MVTACEPRSPERGGPVHIGQVIGELLAMHGIDPARETTHATGPAGIWPEDTRRSDLVAAGLTPVPW